MVAFNVQGMSCGHCVRAISEAVHQVDPQADTTVDLAAGTVLIESGADVSLLRRAIEAAGYSAT